MDRHSHSSIDTQHLDHQAELAQRVAGTTGQIDEFPPGKHSQQVQRVAGYNAPYIWRGDERR